MSTMVTTTAPGATSNAAEQVEANLRDFYDAWRARNGPAMRAFLSQDDRLLIWATGPGERLVGRAEADRYLDDLVATCPPWTSIEPTQRRMGTRDGIAWVADEVSCAWEDGAHRGTPHFRISTIWEESDGAYRLIHAHFALEPGEHER